MRRVQLFIGLLLAVAAAVGVIFLGQLSQPVMHDVVVVAKEIPPYTTLTQDLFMVDTQSMSPAVADKYVMSDQLSDLLASGAVSVENLHPGQPLLRIQVASGVQAEGLSRLSVALKDPSRVIVSLPVQATQLPAVIPGDVVALFYATGNVQAQQIATATISGPPPTPEPTFGISETKIVTTELTMPVAKWLANGVVYRLNREVKENPNYGAPGMEKEPRYIEGPIQALDVVVARADAEWITFALSEGKVQIAVLPAVTRPDVERGDLTPSAGVTWTDFEKRFFSDREKAQSQAH